MAIKRTKTGWRSNYRLIQFTEYMIGGGVYFWSGLAIFGFCFDVLHWHWFISKALADIFGWSANYVIQRYWAFYDSKLKGQDSRVMFRYILVNAVDLVINYVIVGEFIAHGITPYAGFAVSAGFTTIWDYLWYRYWVFKPSLS